MRMAFPHCGQSRRLVLVSAASKSRQLAGWGSSRELAVSSSWRQRASLAARWQLARASGGATRARLAAREQRFPAEAEVISDGARHLCDADGVFHARAAGAQHGHYQRHVEIVLGRGSVVRALSGVAEGTPRGTETGRTCSNPHGADCPPYEITGFRPSFLCRKVAKASRRRAVLCRAGGIQDGP